MKIIIILLLSLSYAVAQEAETYLTNFDNRVYSLKNKGIKDFVVDIENENLTKYVNDQQIFGKVEELIFRTYWTSNPERTAIEVIGLPEGFKEIKDELQQSITPILSYIIPAPTVEKFKGYKFSILSPGKIIAQDTTGVAQVPSFQLNFDSENKLKEIIGNRPIGTLVVNPTFEKNSFSEGKWVLKNEVTITNENSQSMTTTKNISYERVNGISVPEEVEIIVEQSFQGKSSRTKELVEFKNYKINEGIALKYFLGQENMSEKKK